jgi:hypothetical protein
MRFVPVLLNNQCSRAQGSTSIVNLFADVYSVSFTDEKHSRGADVCRRQLEVAGIKFHRLWGWSRRDGS